MNQKILWLMLIIVAIGGIVYWSGRTKSTDTTTTKPHLASALYPLYMPATWHDVTAESFIIGTTSYSGVSITSDPVNAAMNPGSVITPFEKYYKDKLSALGWSTANDLAAGGHVGGQTGYRKGDNIILTRFRIDYQVRPQDAPSECPCSVTFSLFSTPE